MKHRRSVLLLLLVLGASTLAWALLRPAGEPSYNGRPLSAWLDDCLADYAAPIPIKSAEATNALRHIGTNALPCLVKWLDYQKPPWTDPLAKVLPDNRRFRGMLYSRAIRADSTLSGFQVLGEDAAPAIPALVGIIDACEVNERTQRALEALMYIGDPSLPTLIGFMTNHSVPAKFRGVVARVIGAEAMVLGPRSNWAVPVLIQCLADAEMAPNAAFALAAC